MAVNGYNRQDSAPFSIRHGELGRHPFSKFSFSNIKVTRTTYLEQPCLLPWKQMAICFDLCMTGVSSLGQEERSSVAIGFQQTAVLYISVIKFQMCRKMSVLATARPKARCLPLSTILSRSAKLLLDIWKRH